MDTHILGQGDGDTTVVGNRINFRFPVTDRYTTSNRVFNFEKAATKAITAIHKDFAGRITGVEVASIDTWVEADHFALMLNDTPSNVSVSLATAHAAAATGDELVLWPEDAFDFGRPSIGIPASDQTKALEIRSYSPVDKANFLIMGSIARRWDVNVSAGTSKFTDLIFINMNSINSLFSTTILAGNIIYESCIFYNWHDASMFFHSGTGTKTLNNCMMILHAVFSRTFADGPITFHNCMGLSNVFNHTFNHGVIDPGSMTVINSAVISSVGPPHNNASQSAGPTYAAASNFNWGPDAIVPGANSFQNKTDPLEPRLVYFDSPPEGTTGILGAIGPQFPLMFYPSPRSPFKGLGGTVAGTPTRDIFGLPRPTAGAQTIGPVNLEDHDGGIPWDGITTRSDAAGAVVGMLGAG